MAFRTAVVVGAFAARGLALSCLGDACDERQSDETGLMQIKSHEDLNWKRKGGKEITEQKETTVKAPEDKKIVLGVIKTAFHNVTGWVYALALEHHGMDYQVVDDYGHYQIYPMFTGYGKPPAGSEPACDAEGCPNLCEAQGLGYRTPCIDFLTDSQFPGYHNGLVLPAAPANNPESTPWSTWGTAFEYWQQTLYAPKYSGIETVDQAAKAAETLNFTVLGFETAAPGQKCEAMYCPACPGAAGVDNAAAFPYIFGPPLNESGFKFTAYPCEEYVRIVSEKIKNKEDFLTYGWALTPWMSLFPELQEISLVADGSNYRDLTYIIPRNDAPWVRTPGKSLMRKAASHKFPPAVSATMSAIFIGNQGVIDMCGWALTGNLCPSQSWDSACAKEAAQKWVAQNTVYNPDAGAQSQYGTWNSFFW